MLVENYSNLELSSIVPPSQAFFGAFSAEFADNIVSSYKELLSFSLEKFFVCLGLFNFVENLLVIFFKRLVVSVYR